MDLSDVWEFKVQYITGTSIRWKLQTVITLFQLHVVVAYEGNTTSNQRQQNRDLLSSFQSTDQGGNSPSSDQEHPDLTVSPSTKQYVGINYV